MVIGRGRYMLTSCDAKKPHEFFITDRDSCYSIAIPTRSSSGPDEQAVVLVFAID